MGQIYSSGMMSTAKWPVPPAEILRAHILGMICFSRCVLLLPQSGAAIRFSAVGISASRAIGSNAGSSVDCPQVGSQLGQHENKLLRHTYLQKLAKRSGRVKQGYPDSTQASKAGEHYTGTMPINCLGA